MWSTMPDYIDNIVIEGTTYALIDSTAHSVMSPASASTAGVKGLVPAPAAGDQNKYLRGDGTWQDVSGGGGSSISREQITVTVPTAASSWTTDATSGAKVYTAANALTTASPTDIWADLDMSGATTSTAEDLLDAWAMIGRIYTDGRNIKVVCYDGIPETSVTIRITAYTL